MFVNGQSACVQFVDAAPDAFLPKRERLAREITVADVTSSQVARDLTLPGTGCFVIKMIRARLEFRAVRNSIPQ